MLTKMKNKFSKMILLDKVALFMWLVTFVFLLTFIIYDAVSKAKYDSVANQNWFATGIAAIGLVFALSLFASLIITVISAYNKKHGGRN